MYHHTAPVVAQDAVKQAIAECELSPEEQAEVAQNPVLCEQAAESVNISIDDVVVKKQKEERLKNREEQTDSEAHAAHDEHEEHTQTKKGDEAPLGKSGENTGITGWLISNTRRNRILATGIN